MALLLSDFLLNQTHTYNGHFQLCIGEVKRQDLDQIISDLNSSELNNGCSFYVNESDDNSASVYQKNYWKQSEHPLQDTDRLIFGIEKIT